MVGLAVSVLLLSGCGGDNLNDLRDYVAEVQSRQKGRIPPLPVVRPFERFVYDAEEMRAPFASWFVALTDAPAENGERDASSIHPDEVRNREPLERFSLQTLRIVGTLAMENERWALIKSPKGIVSRVRRGNYIGQNHGQIMRIDENEIELKEIVRDGLDGWQERQVVLVLVE
ncbi:MAG: pilus assembly protein PilP [Gammaproteobacteria bacterium]|nr:pilus assembly protein PilP [Gammaproteobacteria bacterium]